MPIICNQTPTKFLYIGFRDHLELWFIIGEMSVQLVLIFFYAVTWCSKILMMLWESFKVNCWREFPWMICKVVVSLHVQRQCPTVENNSDMKYHPLLAGDQMLKCGCQSFLRDMPKAPLFQCQLFLILWRNLLEAIVWSHDKIIYVATMK